MTSPYAWYQYFVNTADADVVRYLRWFTFLSADEIAELEEATATRPHERAAQRRLAREITVLVHGESATTAVEHASQALFGRGELALLDEPTLAAALREAAVAELKPGAPDGIADLLVASGLSPSKGAARRTIAEGGVSVNNRGSTATSGRPRPTTFCTGGGWCCGAASGISPASSALDSIRGVETCHSQHVRLTPTFGSRNLVKPSRRGQSAERDGVHDGDPLRWPLFAVRTASTWPKATGWMGGRCGCVV